MFTENALRDLSVAIGLGDLSSQPKYATTELQMQHQREINALLAARFREKSTDEWMAELEPQGIFCAKVKSLVEAAEDEQLRANDMVVEMGHPSAGKMRLLGTPVRLHGTPPVQRV